MTHRVSEAAIVELLRDKRQSETLQPPDAKNSMTSEWTKAALVVSAVLAAAAVVLAVRFPLTPAPQRPNAAGNGAQPTPTAPAPAPKP